MDSIETTDGSMIARRVSILDCGLGRVLRRRSAELVTLTLGNGDGTVEQLAIDRKEAMRLFGRLAFALRLDRSSPKVPYGSRKWLTRHSVLRAQAMVQHPRDVERAMDQTRQQLPEVWEFVRDELATLKKLAARSGRSKAKPETITGRMRHAMLVLIEAMRHDR